MRDKLKAYRFTALRRADLLKLGVIEEQIVALQAALPGCRVIIEASPRLMDTRAELDKLVRALGEINRILDAKKPETREALNRWLMAASELRHPLGHRPDICSVATLIEAAHSARHKMGNKKRQSRMADPEPIRRIVDALSQGWAAGWVNTPEGELTPAYKVPPRNFREIVHIVYEAMGFNPEGDGYLPEKALRAYAAWMKKERAALTAERDKLT